MTARFILTNLLLLLSFLPISADRVDGDSILSQEYDLLIKFRGQEITAICVLEFHHGIVGTVVNHFGVKVFDFIYPDSGEKKKLRLLNVIKPLNKWYIRRVLRRDLTFILSSLFSPLSSLFSPLSSISKPRHVVNKRRRLEVAPTGEISVSNERYGIDYLFTPITNNP